MHHLAPNALLKFRPIITLVMMTVTSCNLSDVTDDIVHGYIYNSEGKYDKRITKSFQKNGRIVNIHVPVNVEDYQFDENYITILQVPIKLGNDGITEIPDSLHKNFWIIDAQRDVLIGPLDRMRYDSCVLKLQISRSANVCADRST